MNLYADTSALIKRYIHESGSEEVTALFNGFQIIGTAMLTQVEMASAMSKAVCLGWVEGAEIAQTWREFISHWPSFTHLPASGAILDGAVSLIWRHGLRAYDAIHLASAMIWKDLIMDEVIFACYDPQLAKAAREEGLRIWPV